MEEQSKLQYILRQKLAFAQSKNPNYFIRAFSKKLNISPSTLSLVMLGKRKISTKLTKKISENLMLEPQERS